MKEGASIQKMSAYHQFVMEVDDDYGSGKEDLFITDPRGYSVILEDMIQSVKN